MNVRIHHDHLRIFIQDIRHGKGTPPLGIIQRPHFGIMIHHKDGLLGILTHQGLQLRLQPFTGIVAMVVGIVGVGHIIGKGNHRHTVKLGQVRTKAPIRRNVFAGGAEGLGDQRIQLLLRYPHFGAPRIVNIMGTGKGHQKLRIPSDVLANPFQKQFPLGLIDPIGKATVHVVSVKHKGIDGSALRFGIGISILKHLGQSLQIGGNVFINVHVRSHNKARHHRIGLQFFRTGRKHT